MRDKIYTVDLNTKVYSVPVYKQFDNLIPFSIRLVEDGKQINLTGYTILAFFKNKNGIVMQKNCTISENIISTILDNNILSLAGDIKAEFKFIKEQEVVTTFQINIKVVESIDTEKAIETVPKWDLLTETIKTINDGLNDINTTKDNLIKDINENITTLNNNINTSVANMEQGINTAKTELTENITDLNTKIDERLEKEIFDGNYSSLEGAPTKVSEFENDAGYITNSDIDISQNHVHTNKTTLDGITQDKVNSWDSKSDFNGNYESLTNKPIIFNGTYEALTGKPMLFDGNYSSLEGAPTKVSEFENDAGYITSSDVDTSQNHTHINKTVLDEITQGKIDTWDSKTNFSGSYNDLTNKPVLFDGSYNNLTNKPDLTSKAITGLIFWKGTQAEYDAIATKDSDTLYLIIG